MKYGCVHVLLLTLRFVMEVLIIRHCEEHSDVAISMKLLEGARIDSQGIAAPPAAVRDDGRTMGFERNVSSQHIIDFLDARLAIVHKGLAAEREMAHDSLHGDRSLLR